MPRPRKTIPSYLPHKQSGRARAVWTDRTGVRQYRLLPGLYDSPESRAAFAQLLLELDAAPHATRTPDPVGVTVNEVLLAYVEHAERHYRGPDGFPTDEVRQIKVACRIVRELYGTIPVVEFGPLALKAVRQRFVAAGWSRKTVNARVERVRRVFHWAVAEELVPPAVHQALAAVAGLQRGRTPARETEPVTPVDDATVDATLRHLNRHVRGLIEFQRLTGCRPGEACRVRRCDIDMGGAVWLYRPAQHKGTWRGKQRIIAVGPKAQSLLREYFTPTIDDYLFSPRRAVVELNAARSAARRTPCYPSHMRRNERKQVGVRRKRPPAERYNRRSYVTAVNRACDRALPPSGDLARRAGESHAKWRSRLTAEQRDEVKEWQKAHRWSPNQLRHSFATRVRKEHGLEAAQVLLGHSRADVTQVYAERNERLAATIAAKIG
jgi:integrase